MHKLKRAKHTAWRMIAGIVFIVDAKTSELHELSKTGSFIWNALNGSATQEELAQALVKEFEVELKEALKDTADFIEKLKKLNLIELS